MTVHSPSPRTFPIESKFLVTITSWSLVLSSSLIPRFPTAERPHTLLCTDITRRTLKSTCVLISQSLSKHTCDSYSWSIVGSLGFEFYSRLQFFSTSKQLPAEGDSEKGKTESWTTSNNSAESLQLENTCTHKQTDCGGHKEEVLWVVGSCFPSWAAACDTFLSPAHPD